MVGAASNGDIEKAVINPDAEPISTVPAAITAREEIGFYDQGKREYDLEKNRQNLGVLGSFFGAHSAAPTNIAGMVILISFVLLVASLVFYVPDLKELRGALLALIGSCIAFIFGASTKKD